MDNKTFYGSTSARHILRIGHASQASDTPRPPSPPVGPLLESLSGDEVRAGNYNEDAVGIMQCEYIASYNWLERRNPTIIIPGAPPAWTPLGKPRKLEGDSGNYLRDLNAAHFPKYPLEPAVRAALAENPQLHTQDVDLFACSSTLGSLLRFVRGVDRPFRFFAEAVGNTVFFVRRENSPHEFIPNVRGYGHTFPEAYTTWDSDVRGSTTNQRLLKYRFAGLECLMRFECDGYLSPKVEKSNTTSTPNADRPSEPKDIATLIDGLHMGISTANDRHSSLHIGTAGRRIPQAAIFDLKTRSARSPTNVMEEELPRFWIAQIPNFILARHEFGVFRDIKVMDISEDVKSWERDGQNELRRLASLLRKIITTLQERDDRKLEVRCRDIANLELREQDTAECDVLPDDLKTLWLGKGLK